MLAARMSILHDHIVSSDVQNTSRNPNTTPHCVEGGGRGGRGGGGREDGGEGRERGEREMTVVFMS